MLTAKGSDRSTFAPNRPFKLLLFGSHDTSLLRPFHLVHTRKSKDACSTQSMPPIVMGFIQRNIRNIFFVTRVGKEIFLYKIDLVVDYVPDKLTKLERCQGIMMTA